MSHTLLMFAAALAFASPVQGGTVTFNFDSGSPSVSATKPLPVVQTVGGITATFTGNYSLQSDFTLCPSGTGCPGNLTGNYLYPSDVFNPILTISFNQSLTDIGFDYAAVDFTLSTNSTIKLTAYNDSTSNLVGFATSLAVGESWGLGSLTYSSGPTTFNMVQIVIIPPPGGSNFLADNFSVTPAAVSSTVPEPAGLSMIGLVVIAIAGRKFRP